MLGIWPEKSSNLMSKEKQKKTNNKKLIIKGRKIKKIGR